MRLKEIREQHSITQKQLAEKLNVEQNTVSQWETGTRIPRTSTLVELAQILNCSIDDLFGRKEMKG